MKIFLLVLLISGYFCKGSSAGFTVSRAEECKIQSVLLKEIIEDVVWMLGMINQLQNFCKAAAVLSEYKAEQLGLKEKDWRLPRTLLSYTR
ncbi:uncharacterized protein LOC118812701, partial [Tachysurus ichikawai]